jgi:pimeloyl-ACP methyl ester carboxylesterase
MGYWTHKIGRIIQRKGSDVNRTFATVTASYGYFPMLPFLLPSRRRQKVQWFVDQYVQAKAAYPNAHFSFVGHSHGTYLLAKALQDYPDLRFKHIVLAGSVVLSHYPWDKLIAEGRVEKVLNYVATADWVVAFFPKLFQVLCLQDLGAGGHDGFTSSDPRLLQIEFLRGQHSAALIEENWPTIAHFVVHGTHTELDPACKVMGRRNPVVEALGRVPYLVWAGLILLLGWVGWQLLRLETQSPMLARLTKESPWVPLQLLVLVIYLASIRAVLTRL